MTTTTPQSAGSPALDLRTSAASLEDRSKVTATAADLVSQGRRITVRELSRLTGLEPPAVVSAVDALVLDGVLRPAGAAPHHFVFAQGFWPLH